MVQISAACSPIGARAGANPAPPNIGTVVNGTFLQVRHHRGNFILGAEHQRHAFVHLAGDDVHRALAGSSNARAAGLLD